MAVALSQYVAACLYRGRGGDNEVKTRKPPRFGEIYLHLRIEVTCRVRLFSLHLFQLAPHVLQAVRYTGRRRTRWESKKNASYRKLKAVLHPQKFHA